MSHLIDQLAGICRENLLGEKIVIAPSLAIGHQIGDALAQSGTSWVNLRFESIRTLVDAVVGFDLAEEGITVLSRAQALALVEKACDLALNAGVTVDLASGRRNEPASGSYFASLADRPGLHRAVQRSIDDLRLAGVLVGTVRPDAFEDARKARDLSRIVTAYDHELTRGNFIDRAGVLARAMAKLEGNADRSWPSDSVWVLLDDVELSSQEERFLELASEGKLIRLSDRQLVHEAEPPLALSAAWKPEDETIFEFVRASGEENELRAAFRSVLADERQFDSAEILYTRQETYLPLAYELSSEFEIPCTFAQGIASAYTRPGQAALAFLRWVGNGWEASTLQSAVRGGSIALGDVSKQKAPEDVTLSPTSFARILGDARIGWGRDRYRDRIEAWVLEKEKVPADDERREAARLRELSRGGAALAVIERLLELSEDVALGDEVEMGSLAQATSRFVAEMSKVRSEIDGMAQSGLGRMLDELAQLPPAVVSREEGTERLREAVSRLHVAASNPRPGHLHVAPIRAGGWSGRPVVWIAGLDDAKFPGSGIQDPILLDSEREAINESLKPRRLALLGEAPVRTSQQLADLLARLAHRRRVVLSFSAMDLAERRELYPSNAILEVFRRKRNRPQATFEHAAQSMDRAAGFVDERRSLSDSEWWLSRSFDESSKRDAEAVYHAYAWLQEGARATAARESEQLTKWDGLIEAPREEIDPRFTDRIYSASQLERMARCPIGYFFERHLNIEPLDELQRDPDLWLNAMENGSLFHEVVESFMNEVSSEGGRPGQGHVERLHEIADESLQRWRNLVPPPNETAFQKRREELMSSLDVFLKFEIESTGVTAKYFELSFGSGEESPDGIAMPDPLVLDLGRGRSIRLRGRIDRVDLHDQSGLWNVWDYKTGSTFDYERGGLARGTKIQHAIYAGALCAMLERRGMAAKIGDSGYYFPTVKGRGVRFPRQCGDGELEAALNLLFDVVGNGFFPHPAGSACSFCDYRIVCGDAKIAAAQMSRKFEANPDHPAVRAWLQLQEIR